jgi:hypothetical protein
MARNLRVGPILGNGGPPVGSREIARRSRHLTMEQALNITILDDYHDTVRTLRAIRC